MAAMRDVFFDRVYKLAKENRDIVILSADFTAPALDRFRLDLSSQYVFMGISEQNMMLVAAGLALEGKRPICYAISPFLTLRCFEQTKLYASGMTLPIVLAGVGAGVAYNDSGYTHHSLEDIAVMRSLPGMKIYQPCDNEDIRKMTDLLMQTDGPAYLRLDRYGEEKLFEAEHRVEDTFSVVKSPEKITLLASGSTMRTAVQVCTDLEQEGINIGLINANILPINGKLLKETLGETKLLLTLEEHSLIGGLGSHVLEVVSDEEIPVKAKRLGFDLTDGYVEEFGTREEIYELYGVDAENVKDEIRKQKEQMK